MPRAVCQGDEIPIRREVLQTGSYLGERTAILVARRSLGSVSSNTSSIIAFVSALSRIVLRLGGEQFYVVAEEEPVGEKSESEGKGVLQVVYARTEVVWGPLESLSFPAVFVQVLKIERWFRFCVDWEKELVFAFPAHACSIQRLSKNPFPSR